MIERDLDIFGGTVNLASRIAAAAGRVEVLASQAVVEAAKDGTLGFERLDERSLKGIEERVALFRVTRLERWPRGVVIPTGVRRSHPTCGRLD